MSIFFRKEGRSYVQGKKVACVCGYSRKMLRTDFAKRNNELVASLKKKKKKKTTRRIVIGNPVHGRNLHVTYYIP